MAKRTIATADTRPMRALPRRDWLVETAEKLVMERLAYLEARVSAMRGTPGFPRVEARTVAEDLLRAAFAFEASVVAADTARQWHQQFNYGLDSDIVVPAQPATVDAA